MQADAPLDPGETLLLLGNNHISLAVARILGRAGHRLVIGRNTPTSVEHARNAHDTWNHPSIEEGTERFVDALNTFLAGRPDITFLLPIDEMVLLQLLPFRDQVPIPFAAVASKTVLACTDEAAMSDAVARLDLPHALAETASSLDELLKAAERVGYPCIARPRDGPARGARGYIFHEQRTIAWRFRQWPAELSALLLQPYFPGSRYQRHFIAEDGVLLQSVDLRVLRSNQPNGSGEPVESITVAHIDLIDRPTRDLLADLSYTGVGCLNFLIDDTVTRYRFLELTTGVGDCCALLDQLGLDQVGALLALARGETLAPGRGGLHYPAGRRYAWTFGDLMGLLRAIHTRTASPRQMFTWLCRVPVTCARADARAAFSLRDPRPSLYLARVTLGMLLRLFIVEFANIGVRGLRFLRIRL